MGKLILNGKEYVNSRIDGYPPLIYSTDEREVGVWTDGKPLYEKVIVDDTALSGTSLTIDTSSLNADYIKVIDFCFVVKPAGEPTIYTPLTYYNGSGYGYINTVKPTGISVNWTSNISSRTGNGYICVIQYTKTTDTAGSGRWSNAGDQTHHYSTSEQVIGTWIDGKPLYERTYKYEIATTISAGQTNLINVGTDKVIINISALMRNKTNGRSYQLSYNNAGSSGNSTNLIYSDTGYLQIRITNDQWSTDYVLYATIQYTKTTD